MRRKRSQGEAHPDAKLTADKVRYARQMYLEWFNYEEIAELFGCSGAAVRKALIGQTWKGVIEPIKPRDRRSREPLT